MSNKKKKELLLEAELGYKCRDLTDFALDIKRKQEFIDEVLKKLNGLKFSNEPEATSVRETIQLVKSQQLIDSNLKTFQENIDQVNHAYMDKLRERYPNLTKGETELCALLRLRLSTKEIALAKNISPGSVKTLRYRLRKKLNISQDTDLVAHLSKLA